MSPLQQQRIVGAILLMCAIAGVAFFLMSNANSPETTTELIEADQTSQPYSSVVEAMPEGDVEIVSEDVETVVTPENVVAEEVKVEQVKMEPAQIIAKPVDKVIAKPSPSVSTTSNTEPSWLLQIASFSIQENADKIKADLKQLGYAATIETVKGNSGKPIFRVRIGPNNSKAELEKIAVKLQKKLKLQAQIIQKSN
jgi:cell division protein FtsN